MKTRKAFLSGSALSSRALNIRILDVLMDGNEDRAGIISDAVGGGERWQAIRQGREALTFPELIGILKKLDSNGFAPNPEKMQTSSLEATPLATPEFYNSLIRHFEDPGALYAQIELLRDRCKRERGFLKKAFTIFGSRNPLDAVLHDIAAFDTFCQKNSIVFDAKNQQLEMVKVETGKRIAHELWESRFLVAAVGASATGAAGIDLTPAMQQFGAELAEAVGEPLMKTIVGDYPGTFFSKALSWFIVPFTGLSLFKTASQPGIFNDAKILGRFALGMFAGAAISIGLVNFEKNMGWIERYEAPVSVSAPVSDLPPVPELVKTEAVLLSADKEDKSLVSRIYDVKPAEYMLDVVELSIVLGLLYGFARRNLERAESEKKASSAFSRAADGPGRALLAASGVMDKSFAPFMTYGGIPAIWLSLSHAVAENGFAQFGQYVGLYETAFGSMGLAAVAIAATLYASGVRSKDDWKAVRDVATTAFSTSSGAATIPTIKQSLAKMGVVEQVRDLAPLATSFNMVGPTVCLGAIVLYANEFFGHSQTLSEQVGTMVVVLATMLGVRGVPASNVALLSPIMEKQGLGEDNMKVLYGAVLGPDRLLDMVETVINTLADMAALKSQDNSLKAEAEKKNRLPPPSGP